MKRFNILITIIVCIFSLNAFSQVNHQNLSVSIKPKTPLALLAPSLVVLEDPYSHQNTEVELHAPWTPMRFDIQNNFDQTVFITDIKLKVFDPIHQKISIARLKNLIPFYTSNGVTVRAKGDSNCDGVVDQEDENSKEVRRCYLDQNNIFLNKTLLYFDKIVKSSIPPEQGSLIEVYSGETFKATAIFEGWMDSSIQPMRSFYQEVNLEILAK